MQKERPDPIVSLYGKRRIIQENGSVIRAIQDVESDDGVIWKTAGQFKSKEYEAMAVEMGYNFYNVNLAIW